MADADGVTLDARGRRAYSWSQIERFESATHPKGGDAFGAMILRDDRRIGLLALREEDAGTERAGHPVEVAHRIRTLNRLLEEARNRS